MYIYIYMYTYIQIRIYDEFLQMAPGTSPISDTWGWAGQRGAGFQSVLLEDIESLSAISTNKWCPWFSLKKMCACSLWTIRIESPRLLLCSSFHIFNLCEAFNTSQKTLRVTCQKAAEEVRCVIVFVGRDWQLWLDRHKSVKASPRRKALKICGLCRC